MEEHPVIVVVRNNREMVWFAKAFDCVEMHHHNMSEVLKALAEGTIKRVVVNQAHAAVGINFRFPEGAKPMMLDMTLPNPSYKIQLHGRINRPSNPNFQTTDILETYDRDVMVKLTGKRVKQKGIMMKLKTEKLLGRFGCFAIILLVLLIIAFATGIAHQFNRQTHDVTISKTERTCDGGPQGDCYYMVFGTNGEVFENRDALFNWKYNSASVQAQLVPGQRYAVKTTGFRVPFFSMKPNIIDVQPWKG